VQDDYLTNVIPLFSHYSLQSQERGMTGLQVLTCRLLLIIVRCHICTTDTSLVSQLAPITTPFKAPQESSSEATMGEMTSPKSVPGSTSTYASNRGIIINQVGGNQHIEGDLNIQ
jgi:hypothetical protein